MIAVLGGLGAALAFAVTTLCASRSSKLLGPRSVLAWVMIVGLLVAGPVAALNGLPGGLDRRSLGWLLIAGCGNVGGLLVTYAALQTGKVGVIAPIISTEGAIAAAISVAVGGEHLSATSYVLLGVLAVGLVLAAITRTDGSGPTSIRPTLLSIVGACSFGVSLYAIGRAGAVLPVFWAVLPARLVGVVAVAVPLAATSKLKLSRRAWPFVVAGGIAEVVGLVLYELGARHSLAISAVLSSQFGGIAAVIAYFMFHERLRRVQIGGIALIVVGVAALSAIQN
jgi:drug/metabolite transporter (DMT)-like permease